MVVIMFHWVDNIQNKIKKIIVKKKETLHSDGINVSARYYFLGSYLCISDALNGIYHIVSRVFVVFIILNFKRVRH